MGASHRNYLSSGTEELPRGSLLIDSSNNISRQSSYLYFMKNVLIAFGLWLLAYSFCYSQKSFTLEMKSVQPNETLNKIVYKKAFASKNEREKEILNIFFILYDNAYLSASADSIINESLKEIIWVKTGEQYKWAYLHKGNVDEGTLNEVGFREKIYFEKPFYYTDIRKVEEKILTYCENNGHPFASIKLDSIKISGNSISASVARARSGPFLEVRLAFK